LLFGGDEQGACAPCAREFERELSAPAPTRLAAFDRRAGIRIAIADARRHQSHIVQGDAASASNLACAPSAFISRSA